MWVAPQRAHVGPNWVSPHGPHLWPNWAPYGAQLGCPYGTQLDAHDMPTTAPGGLPSWGPSSNPPRPHMGPSWQGWLGIFQKSRYRQNDANFEMEPTLRLNTA